MKLLRASLCVVALLGLGSIKRASAIEIQIADLEAKDGKGVAKLELKDAKSIRSLLRKFRIKQAFHCPRSGFSDEEQKKAISEAKVLFTKLKKLRSERQKKKDYSGMSNASKGCGYALGVIAAYGSLEDVEWLQTNVAGYKAAEGVGQIYFRHGKKLSDFKGEETSKLSLAIYLAKARDKEALAYILRRAKEDEKIKLYGFLDLLMKRGRPEATPAAKEIVDVYLKALAEGKLPNSQYMFYASLAQAVIQLSIDPQVGEDYKKKIDGIVLSENSMRNPLLLMCVKDPRPVFDMSFGKIGKMSSWDESRVRQFNWHNDLLYAAVAGRNSEDVNTITRHYTNLVYNSARKLNALGTTNERHVGILTNQIMDVNVSGIRLSGNAASLCQAYYGSARTSFRFKKTPWIKMQWTPETVLPFVGAKNRWGESVDRLSPFSNEELTKLAATYKDVDLLIQKAFLLSHKMLNTSFISPNPAPLGAVRNGLVRLGGSQTGVAVHTIIQIVTPSTKDKLTVGFKIRSVHHDGGGLASAIGQNHVALKKLSDDHCKSQVSNVRCETTAGKMVELKLVKTTDGGIQLYECPMPGGGVRDLYLRYDWTPMDDSYPLVHALYEPWFALVK
jgi:hypothetical protein